jgi:hypothetical protein
MVNNVIGVVNYVIAARPSLLNFVIADNRAQQLGHGFLELPSEPAAVAGAADAPL